MSAARSGIVCGIVRLALIGTTEFGTTRLTSIIQMWLACTCVLLCDRRLPATDSSRSGRLSIPHYLMNVTAAVSLALGCRTAPGALTPGADAIVEGTVAADVRIDTINAPFGVSVDRARWNSHAISTVKHEFWTDVAVLDVASAEQDATSLDQRMFVTALRNLMDSDPEKAAIAFHAIHRTALDPILRARSRAGLTMALTWSSDWATIAGLERDPDSLSFVGNPLTRHAAVENWAHAFADIPPLSITFSHEPIILRLRRSSIGTPIARVLINGQPHEFWLDTGSSMTVVSADLAVEAGVHLAANDTLALGVVGGSIDARAALIDSLSLGGFTARRVTAALVSTSLLRLDYSVEDGKQVPVRIDGVIGSDLLRYMDLVIDASAETISIRKPRRNTHDVHVVRNLFWVGFPVVRLIAHDGRPLLFGLDTGAESTYVTLGLLRKLPRTHVAAWRRVLGGLGGKKEATEWVATELAVSDGEYAIGLHNVPIGPEHPWNFVNFDGMLGSDVALRTRLHLDFENGVFDVRPTVASKAP